MTYYLQFYLAKSGILLLECIIRIFVKNKVLFDADEFPWTKTLKENYHFIQEEYFRVSKADELLDVTYFSKEQQKSVAADQWSVFPLKIYGVPIPENCQKCPITYECIKKIPHCTTAWFSSMKPNTYVKPHRGTYKGYLRCLFGLVIPSDPTKTGLKIHNKDYHWENSEAMIFDDTFLHSAYNKSDITRVVLYIDFIRPMPQFLVRISLLLTKLFSKSKYVRNMRIKKQID